MEAHVENGFYVKARQELCKFLDLAVLTLKKKKKLNP
jgi:hypothetical protein